MENTLFLMCPIVDILLKMYAHQERGLVFFKRCFRDIAWIHLIKLVF